MNLNIFKIYINKLKKEDFKKYLNSENIILNEDEVDYLYDKIKYNYEKILEEDAYIFNDIKNNINKDSYDKLLKLFNKYKNMYLK